MEEVSMWGEQFTFRASWGARPSPWGSARPSRRSCRTCSASASASPRSSSGSQWASAARCPPAPGPCWIPGLQWSETVRYKAINSTRGQWPNRPAVSRAVYLRSFTVFQLTLLVKTLQRFKPIDNVRQRGRHPVVLLHRFVKLVDPDK